MVGTPMPLPPSPADQQVDYILIQCYNLNYKVFSRDKVIFHGLNIIYYNLTVPREVTSHCAHTWWSHMMLTIYAGIFNGPRPDNDHRLDAHIQQSCLNKLYNDMNVGDDLFLYQKSIFPGNIHIIHMMRNAQSIHFKGSSSNVLKLQFNAEDLGRAFSI